MLNCVKPRPRQICGYDDCSASSDMADNYTFGRGDLSPSGYFEIPCVLCALKFKTKKPDAKVLVEGPLKFIRADDFWKEF